MTDRTATRLRQLADEGLANEHAVRMAERRACAELVRAAGCICEVLHRSGEADLPEGYWSEPFEPAVHDPRCPLALADAIEARGKEGA